LTKSVPEEVRLDRWLMAARFYKTRSQAANACNGRKVKVNRTTAKPHKIIRIGDEISLHHHERYRNIRVLGLAERGIPPSAARELYDEEERISISDSDQELMKMMQKMNRQQPQKYKGRPTKKLRRTLDRFHGKK
jgi:ribosome-associated heat shock protein Hsp15